MSKKELPSSFMKMKNPRAGYLISYFAEILRNEGIEVIFLFGTKKLVLVDINKPTVMGTNSYALKLKPFDNPRTGEIYSYF